MGDIYHAGEVYAGSVPIDDTQASEDTVYSSAKVETMMEEVQDDIEHNNDALLKVIKPKNASAITVNANTYGSGTVNYTIPTGYTPIGVKNIQLGGIPQLVIRGYYIDSNSFSIYLYNESSSAVTIASNNLTFDIVLAKSDIL